MASIPPVAVPLASLTSWWFHENLLLDARNPTGILSILLIFK